MVAHSACKQPVPTKPPPVQAPHSSKGPCEQWASPGDHGGPSPFNLTHSLRPASFPQISLRPTEGCQVPHAGCKTFQKFPKKPRS